MCKERHERGNSEYGPVAFLENNTLEMALEELADLSNYARYTFIKVHLLMTSLGIASDEALRQSQDSDFVSTKDMLRSQKETE